MTFVVLGVSVRGTRPLGKAQLFKSDRATKVGAPALVQSTSSFSDGIIKSSTITTPSLLEIPGGNYVVLFEGHVQTVGNVTAFSSLKLTDGTLLGEGTSRTRPRDVRTTFVVSVPDLDNSPTVITPEVEEREEPVDKEIFNICANVFSLRGSTAQGAPPQEKVLVSSGCTFSQQQLDLLESTGHIVEIVGNESELGLVGIEPIDTPESIFKRDKDGNKIFNVNLVERLVIRDDFN